MHLKLKKKKSNINRGTVLEYWNPITVWSDNLHPQSSGLSTHMRAKHMILNDIKMIHCKEAELTLSFHFFHFHFKLIHLYVEICEGSNLSSGCWDCRTLNPRSVN